MQFQKIYFISDHAVSAFRDRNMIRYDSQVDSVRVWYTREVIILTVL